MKLTGFLFTSMLTSMLFLQTGARRFRAEQQKLNQDVNVVQSVEVKQKCSVTKKCDSGVGETCIPTSKSFCCAAGGLKPDWSTTECFEKHCSLPKHVSKAMFQTTIYEASGDYLTLATDTCEEKGMELFTSEECAEFANKQGQGCPFKGGVDPPTENKPAGCYVYKNKQGKMDVRFNQHGTGRCDDTCTCICAPKGKHLAAQLEGPPAKEIANEPVEKEVPQPAPPVEKEEIVEKGARVHFVS